MNRSGLPTRYEIRALLGEGGSGRVYGVHDTARGQDVALKLVTTSEAAFLRREFNTLRQIRHENLIEVFDWGSLSSGEAYYSMELIEGADWSRRMGTPQPEDEVRRILTGLLRGLAHLHCHGEIHGDLKPANILLGRGGLVKVTDVGMGGSSGKASGVSGTPGYAAPEIWEGRYADERSDIYSIGVMVYEALTGQHPFEGKTVRQVVAGQLEGWVPSIAVHRVRVAADLERAMMRALERDPALRYGTADEWMEGLGVADRVGQILSGKFVGRDEVLDETDPSGSAHIPPITLTCFYGEEGIGRSTILKEIGERLLSIGGAVFQVPIARLHDPRTLGTHISAQFAEVDESLGQVVRECGSWEELIDGLHNSGHPTRVIISVDGRHAADIAPVNDLRRFARAVQSRSNRRLLNERTSIHVFAALNTEPRSPEPHERVIRLEPFDEEATRRQIEGLLGRVDLPRSVLKRLHSLTRGVPGVVSAAIFELIETRALQRRAGCWRYDESQPAEALQLRSLADPLGQLWRRTPGEMRQLLAAVALHRSGIDANSLGAVAGGDASSSLTHLYQLGWLRRTGETWIVASPSQRAFVLESVGTAAVRRLAEALLRSRPEDGTSEDLGDLLLIAGSGPDVWMRGLESARMASSRGEFHLALERAEVLAARHDLRLPVIARVELALVRAAAMNQIGADRAASELLVDPTVWDHEEIPELARIRRARLLGVIYRTIGSVEEAMEWLQEAVRLAEATKDRKEYLQSVADMTQLEWEHGTKAERERAISTIREALSGTVGEAGIEEPRAALIYGLGAALIWNGDRYAAKRTLLEGLQAECSEYWRMRITNALCSATMMLGDYEESLRWSYEAWDHAERSGTDWFRARILANRGATLHSLGRLRESADSDMAAAEWGRRTGNPYEYEAGIAGAAINLLLLARYEDALARANEAHAAAVRARNERHIAKGLELRALAHFYIGDLDEAEHLVRQGQEALAKHEYLDTKPRLDWLVAKIAIERGQIDLGYRKLVEVEAGLQKIPDLEDLWGVQVELYLARGKCEQDPEVVRLLTRVVNEAREAGIRLAWVCGALAIGEIITDLGLDDGEAHSVIRDGLAMAEDCGMLELSWQLAYRLGILALRQGDYREAQARFTHAIRIVKEIASHLTPPHRSTYTKSRRVNSALESMSRQR